MDAEKIYEICPICTRKTRRSDCLVCQACRRLLDRIDGRNTKILASLVLGDTTRSIVDTFWLVVIRGRRGLRNLQAYRAEAISRKEKKSNELWKKAGTEVTVFLRGKEVQHISDKIRRDAQVEILKNLKGKDEEFHRICREVVRWEKSVESLQIYLAGIAKKRKEYQEKKAAEARVEQAVA